MNKILGLRIYHSICAATKKNGGKAISLEMVIKKFSFHDGPEKEVLKIYEHLHWFEKNGLITHFEEIDTIIPGRVLTFIKITDKFPKFNIWFIIWYIFKK